MLLLTNCRVPCLWRNILFPSHVQRQLQRARKNFSSLLSHSPEKSNLVIMSDPNHYRLPTDVKAVHYDITIKTDLKDLTFDGIAKVRYASAVIPIIHSSNVASLHVIAGTSTIAFNTSELELGKACVSLKSTTHIIDVFPLAPFILRL
jgi:hypothetical protein